MSKIYVIGIGPGAYDQMTGVWENMKRNRDDFSVTFETLAKTIIALTN